MCGSPTHGHNIKQMPESDLLNVTKKVGNGN